MEQPGDQAGGQAGGGNEQRDRDVPDEGLARLMLAAFARAWDPTASGDDAAERSWPIEAGAALERLFAAGRSTWPGLAVDGVALAVHIAGVLPRETDDLPAALATIAASDLYLAAACVANVAGALEAFDRACASAINGTIAGIDRAPSFRTDVRQALHERLFVGTAEEPARIGSYAGRGPLTAWVAMVTQRLALLMRRTDRNRARIEDRAASEALPHGEDPELAYLKFRYRDEFQDAYRAALQALPERDRTLLRLNLLEGITLERLGAMFGVNPSTVSRWIEKARATIRDNTLECLRAQLKISSGELASIARLVVSQLDVSLAALLE